MIDSLYKATATRKNTSILKVEQALHVALIKGVLYKADVPGFPEIYFVAGRTADTNLIPVFNHPLTFTNPSTKQPVTVIDVRAWSNQILPKDPEAPVNVPSNGPVGVLVKVACLQTIWLRGDRTLFTEFSDLPTKVYATWVGEEIGRRLVLDAVVQLDVSILAGWFYSCQFYPEGSVSEEDQYAKAMRVARVTGSRPDRVLELVTEAGYISDPADFVATLVKLLPNPRVQNLDLQLLYAVIVGSWFGSPAAREQAAIALEYPPMFIALLQTAASERGFQKTKLGDLALRFDRNNALKNFLQSFQGLMDNGGV